MDQGNLTGTELGDSSINLHVVDFPMKALRPRHGILFKEPDSTGKRLAFRKLDVGKPGHTLAVACRSTLQSVDQHREVERR